MTKEELLDDEIFIKTEFKKHFKSYKQHLKQAESVKDFNEVWSDVRLDFYPYESEMNQMSPAKIYKNIPKSQNGKMVSRLENGKIFYAFQFNRKNWNSIFYLYENNAITILKYDDQNDDDKMLLAQIHHIITDESGLIKKEFFYTPDDCLGDTFLVDIYTYNDKKQVETVTQTGYYEDENEDETHNFDHSRTFRFEYENDTIQIYSKQLKLNGENQFELIYPLNK